MSTRFVPSLQEILYRLVGAATEESTKAPASNNPGRFPVVVRPETRAFLEAQANYLGGSIAGVAGAILDGVAMATQGRDGGPAALRGVAERFNLLIQEHRLSFPAAVDALDDLGFTLADFASVEALQLKLSSTTLRQVAERFYVNYDWLAGKSDSVSDGATHRWYKAAEVAAEKILDAKRQGAAAELIIVIKKDADLDMLDDDGDWTKLPHFIPILARSKLLPGGEELQTYEIWEEGRWSYWRCRDYIKLAVHFALRVDVHVYGRSLSANDYDRLQTGRALPATILHSNSSTVSWHPDDYVLPDSSVAKAPGEWRGILTNDDYRTTFNIFDRLLQGAGGQA